MERPGRPNRSGQEGAQIIDLNSRRTSDASIEAGVREALESELAGISARLRAPVRMSPEMPDPNAKYEKRASLEKNYDDLREKIKGTYNRLKGVFTIAAPMASAGGIGAGLWVGTSRLDVADPAKADQMLHSAQQYMELGLAVGATALILQGLNYGMKKMREKKAIGEYYKAKDALA